MARKHENYKELIWVLAKTDFKLRYHNSVLGYLWAILNPLLIFLILNFVFSSVFARGRGIEHYNLQLLTSIILFNFFSEGTRAGMASLLAKAPLVTKIYVPRWTIIAAATINSAMIFLMNIIVILMFFSWYRFLPSFGAIISFVVFSILTFVLILAFSLFTAPLYVKFRDLLMIWTVLLSALFYATPIIYPLQTLPQYAQQIVLINPIAFVIHFTKEALIYNHFAERWQYGVFFTSIGLAFGAGILVYRKLSKRIAEEM